MTESPRPVAEADDEAVSCVLDGEATLEQAGRVAGSAELSARLEEFRALAGFVGAETAIPAEVLDRIRTDAVAGASRGRQAQVVGLPAAAERRHAQMKAGARIASMAAALLAAGGLGYGIAALSSDDGFEDSALDAAADLDEATDDPASSVAASDDQADSAAPDRADMATETADGDEEAALSPESADLNAVGTETAAQSPCEARLTEDALAAGAAEVDAALLHMAGVSIVVVTGRRHDQQAIDVWMAPEPACEPVSAFSLVLG